MRKLVLLFGVMLLVLGGAFGSVVCAEELSGGDETLETSILESSTSSFLYDNGDGTKTVVSYYGAIALGYQNAITINVFDSQNNVLSEKVIPTTEGSYLAYCRDGDYSYVAYSQGLNVAETEDAETLRIVKYDKDFNRLDSVSVTSGEAYTRRSDSGVMSVCGDTLIFHGTRTRLTSSDGLNHQSNLTVVVDIPTMTVINGLGYWQGNTVAHCFGNLICYDGNTWALLDLGDGNPRAVVIHRPDLNHTSSDINYDDVIVFNVRGGSYGENYTGVTLYGFEASESSYLTLLDSVGQENFYGNSKWTELMLCVAPKDFTSSSEVKQIQIENYIGTDKCSSSARLVKLSESQFMVLWQERPTDWYDGTSILKYLLVDDEGNIESKVYTEQVPENVYHIPDINGGFRKSISTPGLLGVVKPLVLDNEVTMCYTNYVNGVREVFWHSIAIDNQDTINRVNSKIESLPEVEDLTLSDKSSVEEIGSLYNGLSQLGKDEISDSNVVKLNSALVRIAELSTSGECIYQTHIENVGWQDWKEDGEMSGTEGEAKRLEGIRISTANVQGDVSVSYSTHVQNIGWQTPVKDGVMNGTSGKSLRLEAIKINLTGIDAEKYDIYYQVHAQNFGWLDWAKNGESSGTAGFGYRLEGIRVKVVPKNDPAPGSTEQHFVENVS